VATRLGGLAASNQFGIRFHMNFVTIDIDERIQFDRAKLLDVIHYVCAKVPTAELGRVKLHKVLYYADMLHFAASGRPLTGVEYQKQPFGPVARHLSWAVRALAEDGRMDVKRRDYFGFPKYDFVTLRAPDTSRLSQRELQLLDDVVDFVCARSAREISELSHNAAWESVAVGERIPYYTAFDLQPVEISDEDVEWGASEARRILAERNGRGR
jgi:uncharacterized phage-associated protein